MIRLTVFIIVVLVVVVVVVVVELQKNCFLPLPPNIKMVVVVMVAVAAITVQCSKAKDVDSGGSQTVLATVSIAMATKEAVVAAYAVISKLTASYKVFGCIHISLTLFLLPALLCYFFKSLTTNPVDNLYYSKDRGGG